MNKTCVSLLCALATVVSAPAAEKAAFLGVSAVPLDPAIAVHVGLPEGVGLLVRAVAPEGSARDVIEPQDILHKLDEQILVSPDQLAILVRSRKPGDEVKISLIRRGERKALSVKLGETDQPVRRPPIREWRSRTPLDPDLVEGLQSQMRHLRERMRDFDLWGEEAPDAPAGDDTVVPAEPEEPAAHPPRPRQVRPVQPLPPEEQTGPDVHVRKSVSASSTQVINGVAVTVRAQDGDRTVRIEKDGQEVYAGSLNTDEDLQSVPGEYRERVKDMRDSIRVEFHSDPVRRPARIRGPVI